MAQLADQLASGICLCPSLQHKCHRCASPHLAFFNKCGSGDHSDHLLLTYPCLDVLRPVGIQQRGSGLLKAGAGRADVGDHHCAAVASQGILLSESKQNCVDGSHVAPAPPPAPPEVQKAPPSVGTRVGLVPE